MVEIPVSHIEMRSVISQQEKVKENVTRLSLSSGVLQTKRAKAGEENECVTQLATTGTVYYERVSCEVSLCVCP